MTTETLAGVPDAIVTTVEQLPEQLEGSCRVGRFMQIAPGTLLLRVPGVGSFRVCDGRTIEVAPEPDADPSAVDLFLHGAARAALLHQRGELPLHAASVVPPGAAARAIALCGPSGLGKSTLAVAMHRRGWTVLADDTTRVTLENGVPHAWASPRGVKLWQDSCKLFGLQSEELERVRREMQKFYYPVIAEAAAVPLGVVVELVPGPASLERVETPSEKMGLLSRQTFRPQQIAPLGVAAKHLQAVAQTAARILCARLSGARTSSVDELADWVEEVASWPALS